MPYLSISQTQQLHYRDLGRGPVIVLLHGFGMNSAHWLPYALPLSKHYRVIIPDLRGFGKSHHCNFDQDCVLSDFAQDLEHLLKHLSINRFKLVGISMGALTALQYIKLFGEQGLEHYLHIDQSPLCLNTDDWDWGLFGDAHDERIERVHRLAAEFEHYENLNTPYEALPKHLKRVLWLEFGDFFASALSKPSHKKLARFASGKAWLAEKILPHNNWTIYLHCMRAYTQQHYDMRPVLAGMTKPITVVVGLRSDMYPANGQLRIPDYAQHCELQVFAHSGHTPLIDQPIKFMRTLKDFAEQS